MPLCACACLPALPCSRARACACMCACVRQAKVVVDFVKKVKFEVDPQFQRRSGFTQEWYARHASSPITRGFHAPRVKSDAIEKDLDASA